MSPEQARGAASLDGRADQYAVGVMLYQCLTGRLPYESPSLLELVQLIDAGHFRPLADLRSDLPTGLCQVVERAMSRHLRDRFETTRELGLALIPYASERVRRLYEAELSTEPAPDQAERLSLPRGADTFASSQTQPSPPTRSGIRARDLAPASTTPVTAPPRLGLRALAVAGVVVLASLCVWWLRSRPPLVAPLTASPAGSRGAYDVRIVAVPSDASFTIDDEPAGQGTFEGHFARDGREHTVLIARQGYLTKRVQFRDRAPAIGVISLDPEATAPATGPTEPVEASAIQPPEPPPRRPTPLRKTAGAPRDELDIQLSR
jgi:serine/threonine-protein kinase